MNFDISMTLLINALIIFSACQLFLFNRFRNTIYQQEKKIKALRNDIQALLLCSRGVGEKLNSQQSEFKQIQDRQDQLELSDGAGEVSYQQVIALMKRGATPDEMVTSCDLTQGEVELLAHLQKKQGNNKTQSSILAA